MAEIVLNIVRNLQIENADLCRELKATRIERDEWKEKAQELCHIATYAAEQGQRKGLVCLKTSPS